MRTRLLVDSGEFWLSLQRDIRASKSCIYIQTLSFEGDKVGTMLSHELLSSEAGDIRILVDSYTRYVISDRFLYRPRNYLDADLQMEKLQTLEMIRELSESGIQVKFTNPVGILLVKFASRNHKKMILIDDHISYIGGINFSEHNFDWHDLMIRIDDSDIAAFLKNDFLSTWRGLHIYAEESFRGIQLYLYDGRTNQISFLPLLNRIDEAQESIFIESPYISFPFYGKLRDAQRRGVPVVIVAPRKNNRENVGRYTSWEARRSGIDLRLYQPVMTHAKAMLIDGRFLVFGSANFDYLSYRSYQELVAFITETEIISDFKNRVAEVDLRNSMESCGEVKYRSGFLHYLALKALGWTLTSLAKL